MHIHVCVRVLRLYMRQNFNCFTIRDCAVQLLYCCSCAAAAVRLCCCTAVRTLAPYRYCMQVQLYTLKTCAHMYSRSRSHVSMPRAAGNSNSFSACFKKNFQQGNFVLLITLQLCKQELSARKSLRTAAAAAVLSQHTHSELQFQARGAKTWGQCAHFYFVRVGKIAEQSVGRRRPVPRKLAIAPRYRWRTRESSPKRRRSRCCACP